MERWARERREKTQNAVNTTMAMRQGFSSMTPDFDQLATFEVRAQRMAERQEAKETELEVEPVINVMGSTAGAGSGEFHTYRGYRTKELARLADFEKERKEEAAQTVWEEKRQDAQERVDSKHAKNVAKRQKKKEKRKAHVDEEKSERARSKAARVEKEGAGEPAAGAGAEEQQGKSSAPPPAQE